MAHSNNVIKKVKLPVDGVNQVFDVCDAQAYHGTVGTGELTIKTNNTTKGTFNANASNSTEINITPADLGLDAALKFIGVGSISLPAQGQYVHDATTGYYISVTDTGTAGEIAAKKGDVFTTGDKEYVFITPGKYNTPNASIELGDETSYAKRGTYWTSEVGLTTNGSGAHSHSVSVNKYTASISKLDQVSITPAVSNGNASLAAAGTPISVAKTGTPISIPNVTGNSTVTVRSVKTNNSVSATNVASPELTTASLVSKSNVTASKATAGTAISVAKTGTPVSIPNVTGNSSVTINSVKTNSDIAATYIAAPNLASASTVSGGTSKTFTNVASPAVVSITPVGDTTTVSKMTAGTAVSVAKAGTAVSIPNVTGNTSVTASKVSITPKTASKATAGTALSFNTDAIKSVAYDGSFSASTTTDAHHASYDATNERIIFGTNTTTTTVTPPSFTYTAASKGSITPYTFEDVACSAVTATDVAATNTTLGTPISIVPAVANGTITPYTAANVTVATAGTAVAGIVRSEATTPTVSNDSITGNYTITAVTNLIRSTATTPAVSNVVASKVVTEEKTATNTVLGTALSVTPAESNGTITPYTFKDVTASSVSITSVPNLVQSTATTPAVSTVTASSIITEDKATTNTVLGTDISVIPAESNGTITPYTFTTVEVAKAGTAVNVADGTLSATGTGDAVMNNITEGTASVATSTSSDHTHTITPHKHSVTI